MQEELSVIKSILVSVFGKQMINVTAQVSVPDWMQSFMFLVRVLHIQVGVSEEAGVNPYMQ